MERTFTVAPLRVGKQEQGAAAIVERASQTHGFVIGKVQANGLYHCFPIGQQFLNQKFVRVELRKRNAAVYLETLIGVHIVKLAATLAAQSALGDVGLAFEHKQTTIGHGQKFRHTVDVGFAKVVLTS